MDDQPVEFGKTVHRDLQTENTFPCEALMDLTLERLKILNYERGFLEPNHYRPFSHQQFLIQSENTATQFQQFLVLSQWLLGLCHQNPAISENEDPDSAVTKIMISLKTLGFSSSFPQQKLKTPFGGPVCLVLDFLSSEALKALPYKPKDPKPEDDIQKDPEILEPAEEDDGTRGYGGDGGDGGFLSEERKQMDRINFSYYEEMKSSIDPIQWKTELDRVAPRLKLPSYPVGEEWRSHLEQAQQHSQTIKNLQGSSGQALFSLSTELGRQMDFMEQREKTLNVQYSRIAQQYQTLNTELQTKLNETSTLNEVIASMQNDNSIVKEKLRDLRDILGTGKGAKGDTAPIVKIKKAMTGLKKEINALNTQIGVVSHAITQARSRTEEEYDEGVGLSIEEDESLHFYEDGDEEDGDNNAFDDYSTSSDY